MKAQLLALAMLVSTSLVAKDLVFDKSTSLLWQDGFDNKDLSITYEEASNYCSKVVVDGYSNFRLPTLKELQSIVDLNRYKPAIIKGFKYVDDEFYWSSTQFVGEKDEYWAVGFKTGETDTISQTYDRHVRCVKSVQ